MAENSTENLQRFTGLVSYIGTRYCGWQRQANRQNGAESGGAHSIQEIFETVLSQITQTPTGVVASGRTDSEVHARGQVIHFDVAPKWGAETLLNGMNALLPFDVRVLSLKKTHSEFHAQKGAERKQYSYYFLQGPCADPMLQKYSWWIKKDLNVKALKEAAAALVGTHDFKAFQAAGSSAKTSVRQMYETEITIERPSFPVDSESLFQMVRFRIVGSGFLKQMVRGIAGTLLEIGLDKRPASDMKALIESRERSEVGATAPGRGLWLEKVWYREKLW